MKHRIRLAKHISSALLLIGIAMLIGALGADPTAAQTLTPPATTIILVRHAEKAIVPPENKDPDLSEAGQARAQGLAKMFSGSGIAAIYATQFKRTQQTAKPLADKFGIAVTIVDAKKTSDVVRQIRADHAGKVIFVAGHNNTVPEIIAALGGPKMPIISETEYDNLFILTIPNQGPPKLLKLKY